MQPATASHDPCRHPLNQFRHGSHADMLTSTSPIQIPKIELMAICFGSVALLMFVVFTAPPPLAIAIATQPHYTKSCMLIADCFNITLQTLLLALARSYFIGYN
jgi:hypothetical protein